MLLLHFPAALCAGRQVKQALSTGKTMGLSAAMNRNQPELNAFLNKFANLTHKEELNCALAAHISVSQTHSFLDVLKDNWIAVIALLCGMFCLILLLLVQKLKAEHRANEQQRLLEEAAEIAKLKETITSLLDHIPGMTFTKDAKTGVYLA